MVHSRHGRSPLDVLRYESQQVSLRAAKQFAHELLKNPERLARAEARVGGAR